MAGLALVLVLLKKSPSFATNTLHSVGFFSASVATTAAASSIAAGNPFASRVLFGDGGRFIAFADAGADLTEGYLSESRSAAGNLLQRDFIKHSTKEYPLELQPLFSAFRPGVLAFRSLRWFLCYYSLWWVRYLVQEDEDEDDDDFLRDPPDEQHVDLVTPFKKSVKSILLRTIFITTNEVLERLVVHYVSRRLAWKLIKDVSKSAMRKATRGMPTLLYFGSVCRTTFRGHVLEVTALWLVQVGVQICNCIVKLTKQDEEAADNVDMAEQFCLLAKQVFASTVQLGTALVFASFGAGFGATLFHPSIGQSFGCYIGHVVGTVISGFYIG